MGEQKLVWTGLGLPFVGHPAYGNPLLIGGDLEGPGAKPADLLRELEVTTTTTQDPDPPWRFRTIHMHFRLSGEVDRAKAERAVALAGSKYCAVAATLREAVELTYSVEVASDRSV
jgi:uncharacterized OsmC-like protein